MEVCLLVFLAGALQSVMQSFNGVIQGYVGQLGASLITHVVGGGTLILYMLGKREKIRLGPMPWYIYSAGILGVMQVSGSSLCISRIGPAFTTCLTISGQLVQSILIDHFGWMGVKRLPFGKKRVPALLLILTGILLVNSGGLAGLGDGAAADKGGYILLAFILGITAVYIKTINFKATEYLGTDSGTLMNYLVASLVSTALLAGSGKSWAGFARVPAWLYLGGVCGVVALVIIVVTLKKITLFQSTILVLVGQLAGSALLDGVLYHSMSWGKLLGVAIVTTGVALDRKAALGE